MINLRIAIVLTFFSCAVLLQYSAPVYADEIVLENGDRLTGVVKSAEGEFLILETDYSDPVKVRKAKIKRIYVNTPAEIHLSEGEILKGKIRSEGDGDIIVEALPGREETSVKWNNVAAINPPPPKPSKWEGNVTVGANRQSGNTDRTSASIGAEAARRTGPDRYSLRYLFNYAEEDSKITARNTYGAGKYDYFFSEKYYGYLSVEMLNDKFKNLKLRTVVGPGLGYQVWDNAVKSLLFEGGISYFSENLEEGEDKDWVTGRLAGSLRYNFSKAIVFSDRFIAYPGFEDLGEYQVRNEASLTSPLSDDWSLKLANILEHDSNPPVNVKMNDWNWIVGLQYGF